ncbi:ornithine carbamoyltransferase [Enorma sp.]|uniref:ornithine carbamoyltransferase n=1 Tax=Enorma sp. TaxID=1920692 RepID=UPI003AB3D104
MIKQKDFIDVRDFSKEEYLELLETIRVLKEADQKGIQLPLLKGQTIALMFDQPSTRTRVSFESAMDKLGGDALYLETKTMHVGEGRETMKDTALVISGMCDAIECRNENHDAIVDLAKWATVPVFNGMSSVCMHPTQALCDLFTVMENLPAGKKLEDVKVMWVGDNSADTSKENFHLGGVCRSVAFLFSIMGITFISCSPERAKMLPEDVAVCKANYEKSGGQFIQTDDPYEYIDQVDFLFTDAWWYHGSDDLKPQKLEEFFPKYSINEELIAAAPEWVKVMHPLPGNRGYEISNEVWDGPHSLLMEQAANRFHTQKGLLAAFLLPRKRPANEALAAYYTAQVEALTTETVDKVAGTHFGEWV